MDRSGAPQSLPVPPPRPYAWHSLSPDGKQLAVSIISDTVQLWIHDFARGTMTRLTSEAGSSDMPVWSPDSRRLAYEATRGGFRNIFWRSADGTGPEERVTTSENLQTPSAWSPDGRTLAFEDNSATGYDIWTVAIEGERKPQPLLQSRFDERGPAFSPDGRWVAYSSYESGQWEIYVMPFPGPGPKRQISVEGGAGPTWARNGRELFYRNGDKMMAVAVQTEPTFTAAIPRLLFQGPYLGYDVTPDGLPNGPTRGGRAARHANQRGAELV